MTEIIVCGTAKRRILSRGGFDQQSRTLHITGAYALVRLDSDSSRTLSVYYLKAYLYTTHEMHILSLLCFCICPLSLLTYVQAYPYTDHEINIMLHFVFIMVLISAICLLCRAFI